MTRLDDHDGHSNMNPALFESGNLLGQTTSALPLWRTVAELGLCVSASTLLFN